ncbi:ADL033Wp [Eremothecium gossypii ATCC 10895]|uniref:1-phosphatidylinositol 4-kinase n=1 Tax=Eremothecium gossypii (strain ATCC 10895 / CBS 109.51 / FGSC 9923 / NRRL Y-1056) TaxID=284811 RepID=Q75AF0_EREGS|nr:ADL033Wp [Eremothecium gossypii ATCC 10895]AAS51888.1 ADL033Wp [Eremothecium gossypii ATCC 10895]
MRKYGVCAMVPNINLTIGCRKGDFSVRASALKRLSQITLDGGGNLDRITRSLPVAYSADTSKLYTIPLTVNELEILLSVSEAVPRTQAQAAQLLDHVIGVYFVEAPRQRFTDNLLHRFRIAHLRHPVEVETFHLTNFLITLDTRFGELDGRVRELLRGFLERVFTQVDLVGLLALIGFLRAFIDYRHGTAISDLQAYVLELFHKYMDATFLGRVEQVVSETVVNETLVNYFDNGCEVCAFLFCKLVGDLQLATVSNLLDIPRGDKKITTFLLRMQDLEYQYENAKDGEENDLDCLDRFKTAVRSNKQFLFKVLNFAHQQVNELEEGLKFANLNTLQRLHLAYATKASALEVLSLGIFVDQQRYQTPLVSILSTELTNIYTMGPSTPSGTLETVISSASLMNFFTEELSTQLLRIFPNIVSSPHIPTETVTTISMLFAIGLKPLTQDSVVSSVYSLNNLLAVSANGSSMPILKECRYTANYETQIDKLFNARPLRSNTAAPYQQVVSATKANETANSSSSNGEQISDDTSLTQHAHFEEGAAYHDALFKNAVTAVITIAANYNDSTIAALVVTILTQKFRVVSEQLDMIILEGLSDLCYFVKDTEFHLLMKFYNGATAVAMKEGNESLLQGVQSARTSISKKLKTKLDHPMYITYLRELLEVIIARGDVDKLEHHRSHSEIAIIAEQIAVYLKPLATLLPSQGEKPLNLRNDEITTSLYRNIWYNMVVHGFHAESRLTEKYYQELRIIAYNSPPLASDFPANNRETSVDMNTILRRGSSNHNVKEQKNRLNSHLNMNTVAARSISIPKIMFLAATLFLETLRCDSGDCSTSLSYFLNTSIVSSSLDKFVNSIIISIVHKFTKLVNKGDTRVFSSERIASQLSNMILLLSHRNSHLQDCAFQCCDILIKRVPSSLCHRDPLFMLLDSLTMLFDSIVDCETNKYEPCYEFELKHSKTKVMISDSQQWRKTSLQRLHKSAREWVRIILKKANQDVKILLQSYLSDLGGFHRLSSVEFGVSFAFEMAGSVLSIDRELSKLNNCGMEKPDTISGFLAQHSWRSKFLVEKAALSSCEALELERVSSKTEIEKMLDASQRIPEQLMADYLDLCSTLLLLHSGDASKLVYDMVSIPFRDFSSYSMKIATNVWLSVIKGRKDLSHFLVAEIASAFIRSVDEKRGLYSHEHDLVPESYQHMEYSPYDKHHIELMANKAANSIQPHVHVVRLFASHFEGTLFESTHLLKIFMRMAYHGVTNLKYASFHPYARTARNELLNFALMILSFIINQHTWDAKILSQAIINGALMWFKKPRSWPFGSNELKIRADLSLLMELQNHIKVLDSVLHGYMGDKVTLLECFLISEIHILETWLNPLHEGTELPHLPQGLIQVAFDIDPAMAVSLVGRYPYKKHKETLSNLVHKNPLSCIHIPDALYNFLQKGGANSPYVLYWAPLGPIQVINLFLPEWSNYKLLLQYNVRALESHDVNLTFFYVPQLVQCLRYDKLGYVQRFILDTAKQSVLFSHQIIWNMLANSYKDDEATIEDDLKPTLDFIREKMIADFSAAHRDYYQREFGFFNEVTSISGKLKPFIKKTKAEKKNKIDEEMAKIAIQPDVYLPSNPDGVVIDIDRKSGKPLQSHAKAPFMATFKIRKTVSDEETGAVSYIEKWQGAIFKVGDDCRQDVLALQLISVFRTIWASIGMDVYVFPYRVTATAPGCGVIDVLPNSISRDMLGREAVNGLYEYFTTKFGPENSIEFEHARNNFVKSLAAYSVISYLLQFKDRHNGNIMYDEHGHCLHIDFGFIFDIVPGGVKFEAVPFKLTKEMVRVMGGSPDTQAYQRFQELCTKAYLAARPHMDTIVQCVLPMLGSGLPCFKADKTIRHLEARFQPAKSDHDAAHFMRGLIRRSYESVFTKGYDEFQRLTNGIPY